MKGGDDREHQAAPTPADEPRLEAAVDWFMRLRGDEADPVELPRFQDWLREDPRNARAYRQVAASWGEVGVHASALVGDRRDVLDHAQRAASRHTEARRPRVGRRRRGLARVASVFVLLGLCAGVGWQLSQPGTGYATGHDERRILTLDDGTTVSLDASSAIRVDYDGVERSVHLQSGQARFDVARDAARPFRVFARDRAVLALGTQFNVELVTDSVLVTLIEGKVAVGPRSLAVPDVLRMGAENALRSAARTSYPGRSAVQVDAAAPVVLDPGQQLVVAEAGTRLRPGVDVRLATSWQHGELVFDNEPLSSAAARVSRYAARPILVDPAVADVGISGVFKASEPDAFVEAVSRYFPIDAHRDRHGVRLSARPQ